MSWLLFSSASHNCSGWDTQNFIFTHQLIPLANNCFLMTHSELIMYETWRCAHLVYPVFLYSFLKYSIVALFFYNICIVSLRGSVFIIFTLLYSVTTAISRVCIKLLKVWFDILPDENASSTVCYSWSPAAPWGIRCWDVRVWLDDYACLSYCTVVAHKHWNQVMGELI